MSGSFSLPDVSRETLERLKLYHDLLQKWSPKINLVAKGSLENAWVRHFQDSIQITKLIDQPQGTWLDMGSGGGFPGLVVAILMAEQPTPTSVVLMESDQRKCAFLKTVLRETGVEAQVLTTRIEAADPVGASIISARALANLSTLLGYAMRHGTKGTRALFPKGRNWRAEVEEAQEKWSFKHEAYRSTTDSEAVILKVEEIEHV